MSKGGGRVAPDWVLEEMARIASKPNPLSTFFSKNAMGSGSSVPISLYPYHPDPDPGWRYGDIIENLDKKFVGQLMITGKRNGIYHGHVLDGDGIGFDYVIPSDQSKGWEIVDE